MVLVGPAHPYRGGLAVYDERIVKQFQDEGWEVEIITFTVQYPAFLFPGKTQFSTAPKPENLKITRMLNSINPFSWIKTGRKIRRGDYDLVLTKYWLPFMAPCLGKVLRIARKNKKTTAISILDNVIPHEHHFGDRMLTRYFVRSADGFVAMSQSVLNDLRLFDKQKPVAFCPHPLFDNFGEKISRDQALQNLNLDKDCRYLLFFGLVRAYKGLDWLIEAFADKRLRSYPVKLIVAGEFYDDKKPYLDRIAAHQLTDKVIVYDEFIPDAKVRDFFNACDLVVQPYKTATQSGITQIAYHFEKPMLVTNVGGLGEIVPDGKVGYAVHPDAKSIADALVDFFANHRQDDFKQGILSEKEKYSWSRMSAAIQSLFTTEKKK